MQHHHVYNIHNVGTVIMKANFITHLQTLPSTTLFLLVHRYIQGHVPHCNFLQPLNHDHNNKHSPDIPCLDICLSYILLSMVPSQTNR